MTSTQGYLNYLKNSSKVANKADISDVEELEETLTAAVTDINTRTAENTALAELAEQVKLLTEMVKTLEMLFKLHN